MINFFYISNYQTPHLETDLELIKKSVDEKNKTHVLRCRGFLQSCFQNQKNSKLRCKYCISKVDYGLNMIKNINIHDQKNIKVEIPNEYEINSFDKILNYKYENINIGKGVVSSLISIIRDHKFDVEKHQILIKKSFYSAILNFENFKLFLNQINPDNVFFFNGRFSEIFSLIELCKAKNINFYTHERGSTNYKFMLRKNNIPHSIDFTTNEIKMIWNAKKNEVNKEKIGKSFFEERIKGIDQNWISFSKEQEKNKLPNNFNSSKINISIFNSSIDEYETIPDFKNLIYKDDNDGIKKICESFITNKNLHFYLRVHPNLKNLNNTQIFEIRNIDSQFENITVIYPEEKIDSYELIKKSDAVITFNSTIGVEALYLGTKSILLGRAFYESLNDVIKCNTHEELINIINEIKKEPKKIYYDHIKYGFWAKQFGVEYIYFKPTSLFKGKFMNKNLSIGNLKILMWKILNTIFY